MFEMPEGTLPLRLFIDANAAIGAIKAGYSRQMRYLSKTQGVSIAWLAHVIDKLKIGIFEIDTGDNSADIHTKELVRALFERHCWTMGLRRRNAM